MRANAFLVLLLVSVFQHQIAASVTANFASMSSSPRQNVLEISQLPRLRGGSENTGACSGPTVPVNFQVSVHHIRPKSGPAVKGLNLAEKDLNEQVVVVGNIKELGEWNLDKGVVLHCAENEFPLFKGTVNLPPGSKVEYKYVVVRKEPTKEGIQSQWEANNRQLAIGQTAATVINGFIENRATDPRITEEPFQLTSQEWSRWFTNHLKVK